MAIKSQGSILNQYIPPFCLDSPVDGEILVYDKDEKAWVNQPAPEDHEARIAALEAQVALLLLNH